MFRPFPRAHGWAGGIPFLCVLLGGLNCDAAVTLDECGEHSKVCGVRRGIRARQRPGCAEGVGGSEDWLFERALG